jgi:biotin carboxyl carrier protein
VGAGDFGKQVGGSVETSWRGETDAFGEVEFDYTAGFAAKTVILTAKDLDSGGVAVDYITAYKEASIDIALKKVVSRAAVRRSTQYVLKVEASRSELTADGRSRSVIRATLTDPNGTTVPGDPVAFSLSTPNGTLRTIQGTTDASGVATAEYVAGKKIGIVVVTATATFRNVQGQVSITLLADAPAKIFLAARPDNLPADGFSRSDIQVKVTDINDNPNRDTKVEFKVARGGGKVEFPDRITDRFGEAANRYTAGTEAGIATILATVRSAVPTEAELAKARNVLFVPYNPEGEEVRVERWLKKKGDAFARGEPLVEYTVGRQKAVNSLPAPFDGTMKEILVEYWDKAEVGQSLAVLEPAKK